MPNIEVNQNKGFRIIFRSRYLIFLLVNIKNKSVNNVIILIIIPSFNSLGRYLISILF